MDAKTTLEHILTIVGSVFDAYSAVLFLPNPKGNDFTMAAAFSLGEHVKPQASVRAIKGVAGWIIKNNRPLLINNLERKKAKLGYYDHDEESQIKAFMGCPLSKDKGKGALCLDSKRTYSFSDKDHKILFLFAQLIQDVVSRSSAVEDTFTEIRFRRALKQIMDLRATHTRWPVFLTELLGILSETTGFPYCFFASRGPDGDTYALEGSSTPMFGDDDTGLEFDIQTGLLGWVFKNNAPVFTGMEETKGAPSPLFGKEASAPETLSVICLPLHFQRSTRAVLCLAHDESVEIDASLKDFSLMVAEYLTLFLENLYQKTQLHQPSA
ncbi:MAG: GAF domain-containing protein [Desulfovibrio sp.]|nr:MAG: GAF domain-containing protein [Desulfovibrio sp.]